MIEHSALAYLATPFSLQPDRWRATIRAAQIASDLIRAGVNVFAPIAHGYLMTRWDDLDPLDAALWERINAPFLKVCDVLIVAQMEGWEESKGMAHEIAVFEKAGKPIFDLDPITLKMVKRP